MKMNLPPFIKALNALGIGDAVQKELGDAVKAIVAAIQSSVVTKTELEALTAKLRDEMKAVADERRGEINELRGETKAIAATIQSSAEASKTELEASTAKLRGEINELRRETKAMAAELRCEISSAVNKMLLAQLAIAGLLFAALRIWG